MKKSLFLSVSFLFLAVCLSITSCKKDDKDPEIVVDPVANTTEYYVAGKVVSGDAPLSGVSVAIGDSTATTDNDGYYTVTVTEKKTHTVSFEKTGYLGIPDAEVEVPSSSTNRSLVMLNVSMSQMGVETTVDPSTDITVTENGAGASTEATAGISIPAGALSESASVSITPYTAPPSSSNSNSGSSEAASALTNLVISSSKPIVLNKDITLAINNKSASSTSFRQVEVHKRNSSRADDDWTKVGDASFNAASNTYDFDIKAGSTLSGEYSVRVKTSRSVSSTITSEINIEKSESNAGSTSAIKGYTINYTAKAGWDYTSSFTGIDSGLATMLRSIVSGQEGGTSGYYNIAKTFTTDISGGYIMYYRSNAKFVNITYAFEINGGATVNVTVKHYTGMAVTYTNVSANQHSGGSAG